MKTTSELINEIQNDIEQLKNSIQQVENDIEMIKDTINHFIICIIIFLIILIIEFIMIYTNHKREKNKESLLNDIFWFFVIDVTVLIFVYIL